MDAHKEFIVELAEKYELPEEQIKLVIYSFYEGFKYYLTHPIETKDGILLNALFTTVVSENRIEKHLERLKLTENKTTKQLGYEAFYKEMALMKQKYKLKTRPNRFKLSPTHERQNSNEFQSIRSASTIPEGGCSDASTGDNRE